MCSEWSVSIQECSIQGTPCLRHQKCQPWAPAFLTNSNSLFSIGEILSSIVTSRIVCFLLYLARLYQLQMLWTRSKSITLMFLQLPFFSSFSSFILPSSSSFAGYDGLTTRAVVLLTDVISKSSFMECRRLASIYVLNDCIFANDKLQRMLKELVCLKYCSV
jgi:hypothetical protein